ncbi:MAG: hypothetical protein AB7T37_01810 [Dehalococcoidia bacterium]
MIQHVAYREEHFSTARSCVRGIRRLLALGWTLLEGRGAAIRPFLVLCRKDEPS